MTSAPLSPEEIQDQRIRMSRINRLITESIISTRRLGSSIQEHSRLVDRITHFRSLISRIPNR